MRLVLCIATSLLLAFALGACGADSPGGKSVSSSGSNFSTHHNDRDNDGDHNDDDAVTLGFGHAANAADRRESVALVTRYFAAAVAANGVTGCALLVPFVAESVVEDDGHSPGLFGSSCAAVLAKLFKLHHRELVAKQATMKVIEVRVRGDRALAILDFPNIPEVRQIDERRVGDSWKLLQLLDRFIE
jgi:hypothetical protein